MGIGKRIKEAREHLGLTQEELGKQVGVTGSAITNYEKEVSHPKEPVMYSLLRVLKVDANYLFQDCVEVKNINRFETSYQEQEHIKKYRALDRHGKDMVDVVLEKEYVRVQGNVTPLSPEAVSIEVGNIAARGGGVHVPDEEELKDMQAVYEKLVLPAEEKRRKRNQGDT